MSLEKEFNKIKSNNKMRLPPIYTLSEMKEEYDDTETGLVRTTAIDKFQTSTYIILNFYKPISRLVNISHEKTRF